MTPESGIQDSRITSTLTQRVDLKTLHLMQDRFARLGRMTVCICTVDGELITEPTWGSGYSQLIGASTRGQTELLVALRASSNSPPTRLIECHAGMALDVTPIPHGDVRLALLVVGTRSHSAPTPERVYRIAADYEISAGDLLR